MMHVTLQPILDLLDEGLRLYRRNFVSFLLLTAIWFVPVAIGIGATVAAARYGFQAIAGLLTLGWILLALPLAIYLVAGMSRATLAAQAGQPVRVGAALAIHPLRAVSMGFSALVFSFVANAASSTVLLCIICPLYSVAAGVIGGAVGLGGNGALGGAFAVVFVIMFGVLLLAIYALALVLSGASYAGVVYALQSFIQEDLPFGMAFGRGFTLIGYRFGQNLLAFMLTSAVFGAAALAVTIAVGTIVPLPLLWLLGSESPVVQSISATAWLLGLIVVLPPLPIWMTLLYRRNLARREGWELAARIEMAANVHIRNEVEPQRHRGTEI